MENFVVSRRLVELAEEQPQESNRKRVQAKREPNAKREHI